MNKTSSNTQGYLLAAALGAIGGGIFVVAATRAIPKMMSRMMSQMMPEMMKNMREQMKARGGSSADT